MTAGDPAPAIEVVNAEAASRYEARVDGHLAVAEYRLGASTIAFTHTFVPPDLEGRGVANALARRALDDARAAGRRVVPRCRFFAAFIRRHAEYADLVADGAP